MRLAAVLLSFALAATAAAAPARMYGERGGPTARGGIEARIEAMVAEAARKIGREPPRADARLEAAAVELARLAPPEGRPSNELVEAALWLHGIVEPPPHLLVVTMTPNGADAMLAQLRARLPEALAGGRFRRMGAAAEPRGHDLLVVLALEESDLALAPVPRALPPHGSARLSGRLRPPLLHPEAFVTGPDGKVRRVALAGDATRFDGRFACGPNGRYQLELNGDDSFGAKVVANFPLYCGVPAPRALPAGTSPSADERAAFSDPRQAEREIARLVSADRARAGLPPLAIDERLSAVARAHSADMLAHHFVGHISPTTGSAEDRLRRARIEAALILENVARAYSPGEAERGLMASPGHRANVLNRDVSELGVGVAAGNTDDGGRELFVTQLFIRPPARLGSNPAAELRRRVEAIRRQHHLGALAADPALDALAEKTARALAAGTLRPEHAGDPIDAALGGLAGRYRSLKSVVAMAIDLPTLAGGLIHALSDGSATAVGLGLAPGARAGAPTLYCVMVLATRR